MTGFFGSLVNAAYYTLKAMGQDLPHSYEELLEAQRDRMHASTDVLINRDYDAGDIAARKQYWYSQLLFLTQLPIFDEILEQDVRKRAFYNEDSLYKGVDGIMNRVENDEFLKKFLRQVENPPTKLIPGKAVPLAQIIREPKKSEDVVITDDIANQIKILAESGHYVIVNDAANSHRDGASKIAKGTVEETIGRFTNGAVSLAPHFSDVYSIDAANSHIKGNPPKIDVVDYQRRYLKMVLNIMKKMIDKPNYLESAEFFDDLLKSYPCKNTGMPIYFGMQDTVYKVPTENGYFSERQFQNTEGVSTLTDVFSRLSKPSYPVGVTSFAAPDLRKVEVAPLDVRCTSDRALANSTKEGALATMMHKGISFQCQKAIEQAKTNPGTVHVLFILQGCGAFKNPEKIAAANFISTIKYYEKQFQELNIDFNIVEFDANKRRLLVDTYNEVGTELFELNSAIENTKNPYIKDRAIALRERILDLYNDGSSYKEIQGLITSTSTLLNCTNTRCKHSDMVAAISQFKDTVNSFHEEETVYIAMRRLLSNIAKFFFIDTHLDKDLALKDAADELLLFPPRNSP